jgi:hypothetical protein
MHFPPATKPTSMWPTWWRISRMSLAVMPLPVCSRACRIRNGCWRRRDQKDLVAELDINPIICTGEQMIAGDALIVRATRKP